MSVPSPPASSSQRFFAALHAAPVRRVRHGKVIAGTAAGVARYFGIDPIVVRVAFVLFTVTGIGVTSYLIAWFLLPDDDDTVLVERAVRDHHGGAITLGVFAALSIFSGDHGGWKQSLTTALVIGAIGFYLWRRHTQRGGTSRGGADATSGVPTAPPPPAQRPGAPEHGSPTRGGFSRFDPVTGRWVPATSGPAPAAAVPHRQSEPVASGEPVDRLDTPIHPFGPGRAATWAAPGSPPVSADAGAAETGGLPGARAPRRRLAWWANLLVLLLAAGVGTGAAFAAPGLGAAQPSVVGYAGALVVVALGLLLAGITGRSARPLIVATLILLPAASGVIGFEVAAPPQMSFRVLVGAP